MCFARNIIGSEVEGTFSGLSKFRKLLNGQRSGTVKGQYYSELSVLSRVLKPGHLG
jgi:hypothetical protein